MEFLRQRLEEITLHKLDIIALSKFVEDLCASTSQATKLRTELFLKKWQNDEYVKSVQLGYIFGSWAPLCSATSDLHYQRPWNDYLRSNYHSSLGKTTIGEASAEFKPFNFKELVQMPFWKDLYNTFGQKTIGFIFDKALIIVKVEDTVFLIITTESCALGQKLTKTAVRKRKAVEMNMEDSKNPYQLQKETANHQNSKRCRLMSENLNEEFRNKIKIGHESQILRDPDPPGGLGIKRWFIPTAKVLKFIIEERERLKTINGIGSAPHSIPLGITEINFVGIVEDTSFLKIAGNDTGAIIKESGKVKFPLKKKLPPQWEGLIISQILMNSATSAYVNVFKISETFARNNKIHIKIKQRRKKHRQHSIPTNADAIPEFNPQCPDAGSSLINQINRTIPGRAFDPLVLIGTLPALYNKSTWSRWPRGHIITAACQTASIEDGARILLDGIFNTDVGSSINGQIALLLSSAKIKEMDNLFLTFKEVITFHQRIKNFHGMVKSCLTFWMIKKQSKLDKKYSLKAEKTHIRSQLVKSAYARNKSVEVIDLTTNTPSTAEPYPEIFSNETAMELSVNAHNSHSGVSKPGTGFNSSELKTSGQSDKKRRLAWAYAKLKEKIPPTCISLAIKQIFHLSKLENLLGSKRNVRGFFGFVRKSVVLAGSKSALQLGQLMALLNPEDCEWLKPIQDSTLKCALLAKVSSWLFTNYVMTLLKTSFYITEISDSRLHTSFYLREAWVSICEHMKHRFTKSGALSRMGCIPNRKIRLRRNSGSINASIRFLPKKNNDLRPILSLKQSKYPLVDLRKWTLLINLLIQKLSPHRIRDNNIVRTKWLSFLQHWKKMHFPKLWFVRADIKDAYPSVEVTKLREIFLNASKSLGEIASKDFRVISSARVVYRQCVMEKSERGLWSSSILIRPCIVQDTNRKDIEFNAEETAKEIVACFNQNVVRIGKHKYGFEYGLPQGWKLSEGLCNIYYGNMDSKYLSQFLYKKGEFLITSVDDYLYITPDPIRASRFYKKMQAGMPDFGCKGNENKIFSNIYPRSEIPCAGQNCEWVDFCGWKFCLSCGHIMRDFSSYKGQDMASTLSFNPRNVTSPENFLISRMKIMLPARLQSFLLDPAINCKNRIILNIYEAAFVFAFRFYAICRVVYPNLNAVKEPQRAVYITAAIYKCTKILSRMVANIFRHTYPPNPAPSHCMIKEGDSKNCKCVDPYIISTREGPKRSFKKTSLIDSTPWNEKPLEEAELLYIVYHAFILKLKKHSQVFKDQVLPKLYKMRHFQKSLLSPERAIYLFNLLGNCMPPHFEDMKI